MLLTGGQPSLLWRFFIHQMYVLWNTIIKITVNFLFGWNNWLLISIILHKLFYHQGMWFVNHVRWVAIHDRCHWWKIRIHTRIYRLLPRGAAELLILIPSISVSIIRLPDFVWGLLSLYLMHQWLFMGGLGGIMRVHMGLWIDWGTFRVTLTSCKDVTRTVLWRSLS